MITDAKSGYTILLGRLFDNKAITIRFDVTKLATEYGWPGTFAINHKRPTLLEAYPVASTYISTLSTSEGYFVDWQITDIDTQFEGNGEVQLFYTIGNITKYSTIYKVNCKNSLTSSEEIPNVLVPWIDQVRALTNQAIDAKIKAVEAKDIAVSAKDTAVEAKNIAVSAKDSAIAARDEAVEAEEKIENMTATASVSNTQGIPSVVVTKSETSESYNLDFAFENLKGPKGDDGLTTSITMNGETKTQVAGNIDLGTVITDLSAYRTSSEQDIIDATKQDILSGSSKVTIENNVVSTSANLVSVSPSGASDDVVQYITIDGVEKKLPGGAYFAGTGIDITNGTISNLVSPLVPAQATTSNQLADKAFVNSSVQTATANFRGNWSTWANVPTDESLYPADYTGSKTPTVNDYLVVQNASDYSGTALVGTWRFKYSGTWSTSGKSGWLQEYQVNEEPMTAAQVAALNSGATSTIITNTNSHLSNTSNPHSVTKAQVGLGNVGNFKAVSTEASQGLSETEKLNARTNIGQVAKDTEQDNLIDELFADYSELDTAVQTLSVNKQDKLTAGSNVQINNNVISATDTTYTAGENITITNNVISAAGLPSGTTAGQALIFDGTSWTKQSGYGYEVSGSGATITWDGDTTGKTHVVFVEDEYDGYLVSTNTPSQADLTGATCVAYDESTQTSQTLTISESDIYDTTEDFGYSSLMVMPEGLSFYFFVIPHDVTSPSIGKGIYFPKQEMGEGVYAYITNLSYGTVGSVTKIDSKFIPSDASKEDISNKVTTITSSSTNTQYPSAKLLYDQLQLKENADTTILKKANVINNVTSTDTDLPLSANMGKTLQDEVNNLKNIGRFLSIWDASTGAPSTDPTESPYSYKVGDYYRIGVTGTKNPANNSTYIIGGTNWVEGESLEIGDVVYVSNISGATSTWVKQAAGSGGTVQDVQVNGTTIVASGTGVANITDAILEDVKYTTQSLTDPQKAQARTNIGAGTPLTIEILEAGDT